MPEEERLTLYEEDFYRGNDVEEDVFQLVVFRLSREWYGVEITKTREILKIEGITYLPSSPEHVAGIFNLRGNILSVTDLKSVFGLPYEEMTERSRIVVVESGIIETGFLVDELAEVTDVPVSKIDPTLTTISPHRADYLDGECRIDDKLIGVLNIKEILRGRRS